MKILPSTIVNYKIVPNAAKQKQNSINSSVPSLKSGTQAINSSYQAYITPNMPISYTKLGEIPIPGLKSNASLFQLANGQKVLIAKKKGPTYVKTTYNVGSLNETENIRGISHFIEHNLFNGSKELAPREYDKRVSDLGGYTNASTGFSATDYYLKLQLLNDSSLENAIKLNAQQTQFPTFPLEQLEKEKEPVKSEIDMYKDMPSDVASSIVLKNLFNINTNSTNFILGTKENINSFTRDTVMNYYNTWYTPDNAVTVITGDVDTNETIQLVSKYFNKRNDYSQINQRHYEPISYNTQPVRQDIIQPNASTASVTMGFAIPEGTTKAERDKISVLIGMLTSTGSDLSKRLEENGLNVNIYTEHMQNKADGAGAIIINVDAPERQIETVIKTIYEELQKAAAAPASVTELENIKKRMTNALKSSSETSSSLNAVLTEMALTNNYNYYNETNYNIQSISANDIMATAGKYLDLSRVSICVSHEKNTKADEINRNYNSTYQTGIVSFGASKSPITSINEIQSDIRQYKLGNNIETSYMQSNTSAKSSFWLNLSSDELNNVSSPALLVINELLSRGTLLEDKDTYNGILNSNDIDLVINATQYGLDISADFNDENLYSVMGLINETLMYPNFTESEFKRAKEIIKDYIQNEQISAYDRLNQELYPKMKLFASKEERLKQLEALTLDDIRNTYALILSTSQAHSTLSAPIQERPYIIDTVNGELSKLPVFKPYSLLHTQGYKIYEQNKEAKVVSQADEKAQAEIVQAYKYKTSQNIDDIAKINILNMILGGSMSSRLFTDLRENQKLAYHVSSSLTEQKDCSAICLRIGTTTDSPNPNEGSPLNAIKALEGFNNNVVRLMTEDVSQKELENAKIRYKSKLLEGMETNSDLTSTIGETKNSPYGLNFYPLLFEAIDKLTVDDIRAAANHVFKNPPVTSIVASQKTLNALGL